MKKSEQLSLAKELQSLLHKHGCSKFMFELSSACFNASDDTADFGNKSLSVEYAYYGEQIDSMIYKRPIFLGDMKDV